jgi:hypothetical protein
MVIRWQSAPASCAQSFDQPDRYQVIEARCDLPRIEARCGQFGERCTAAVPPNDFENRRAHGIANDRHAAFIVDVNKSGVGLDHGASDASEVSAFATRQAPVGG